MKHPDTDTLCSDLLSLRDELVAASEDNDWEDVQAIDGEICELLKSIHPDWKQGELANVIRTVKQTYNDIIDQSRVRRRELESKMDALRKNRDALEGYKTSLAAGNREVRATA